MDVTPEPTIGEEGAEDFPPLDFDKIPIERHWELSMVLHDQLGHTEPWEMCEVGCGKLASDAIRILFGASESPDVLLATQGAPDEELTVDPNVLMAAVEEAMQRYWDSFVGDTGCVPTEFAIEGPPSTLVSADFAGGNMAECVVEAVLTTLTTGAPDQELRRLRYIERYARSFVMGQGRSRVLSESEWSIYQGHLDALTAALTPPDDGTGQ